MVKLGAVLRKLHVIWIRLIRRNSQWKEFTPWQKELFDSVSVGDIVECWMPLAEEALAEVEESHKRRPYYVVEKRENSLLCFYGTSQKEERKSYARVFISQDCYNVWKDGFMCLDRICEIPVSCLIRRLDTLNDSTLQTAVRKMSIMKHRGGYSGPMFPGQVEIKAGDIVRRDKKTYYIRSAGRAIEAYRLRHGVRYDSSLYFDQKHMDVHHPVFFQKNDELQLLHVSTNAQNAYAELNIHPVRHSKKPVKTLAKGHYYKYNTGRYFCEKWNDDRIMYLFSRNGKDYGICERDITENHMKITRFYAGDMVNSGCDADDDTMTYVLNTLIDSNSTQWGWLEELMVFES